MRWFAWIGLLILIAILSGRELSSRIQFNMAGLQLLRSLDNRAALGAAQEVLAQSAPGQCRAYWLLGVASRLQGSGIQNVAWKTALECSPEYVPLARSAAPHQLDLAQTAVGLYPHRAEGWLWLGDLQASADPAAAARSYWQGLKLNPYELAAWRAFGKALIRLDTVQALALYQELHVLETVDLNRIEAAESRFLLGEILTTSMPEEAIKMLQAGLEINPYDGVRWRELGDLLRDRDPQAALQAYLQSCEQGDPGSHGCLEAGRLAEKLGDLPAAVRYYRRSRFQPALDRANELERQLMTPLP